MHLHDSLEVVGECLKAELSDKCFNHRRKKFDGLSRSQVSEMKLLKNENESFKKFVADL